MGKLLFETSEIIDHFWNEWIFSRNFCLKTLFTLFLENVFDQHLEALCNKRYHLIRRV
jgi:hypothetical protein